MPQQRKKHNPTEYEKARDKYRMACPRHVVTFESDMTEDEARHAFAYADSVRMLGNEVAAEMNSRITQLNRTRAYRALKKDYGWHVEHMKNLDEDSPLYTKRKEELSAIATEMQAMQKKFHVTSGECIRLAETLAPLYSVGTIFAHTRGEAIWEACSRVLYGNGKRLRFRKRGDLPVIRAKQENRGIVFHPDENGDLWFSLDGVGEFSLRVPKEDFFLVDEYDAIRSFLANPEVESFYIDRMEKTKEVIPVFRPCYASLKCKEIRGRLRVFVQITVAANPVPKRDRFGELRHPFFKHGRVGCDNGSQSIAAVSDGAVLLENTAERGGKSTKDREHLIRVRQKKMAASRRQTNPERFHPDGTYIKGKRGPMKKSRHYRRLHYLVREQQRRDAASRKYAVLEEANCLRSLGDELIIEPSNAKSLQRRSGSPTEKSKKTIDIRQKDGTTKTVHKNKQKSVLAGLSCTGARVLFKTH